MYSYTFGNNPKEKKVNIFTTKITNKNWEKYILTQDFEE